ncbi:MAG: phage holin family protein [Ramlibacter sp.]
MSATGASAGLFASLRQLLSTTLEIAQVRLQLLGNDLEREKLRLFDGLLLAGVGLMLLAVGTVLLCGFVIMLFAEGYRLAALGVLTVAFLSGGILMMRAGGRKLQSPEGMFDATLGELSADRAGLAPREPV